MFRSILAGTDGSDGATLALEHAVVLAERLDAELTVLTVHAEHRTDSSVSDPPDAVIARALLRDVEAAYGGRVRLRTRAAGGNAAEVLLAVAEQDGHDLVVVGNRGISGEAMLQPASVPGRVSRRAPAVLVVDTVGRRPPRFERILVATDGSAPSVDAEETAVELAAKLAAELEIAAFGVSEGSTRRLAEEVLARRDHLAVHRVTGEPSAGLGNLAQSGRYDLLILGNKGTAGFRRALGSVSARVLRRAPTNVLIVRTAG
jgi:nucleotide-binding universal stress UspA family protein